MRWMWAFVVCAGCFAPHPQPGARCAAGSACPDGLVCSAADTCELGPTQGSGSDGGTTDGPTLVQQVTAYAPQASSLTATFPNPPIAGHMLVLVGGGPHSPLDGISGGATWNTVARSPFYLNEEIWVGVADGSRTVTTHIAGSTNTMFMLVTEWSGVPDTGDDDDDDTDHGSAGTASPGSASVLHPPDLVLFGISAVPPNQFGTPSGGTWTKLEAIDQPDVNQGAWYMVARSRGLIEPSVSVTGQLWDGAIVSLPGTP